jgi:hypothetical protein
MVDVNQTSAVGVRYIGVGGSERRVARRVDGGPVERDRLVSDQFGNGFAALGLPHEVEANCWRKELPLMPG